MIALIADTKVASIGVRTGGIGKTKCTLGTLVDVYLTVYSSPAIFAAACAVNVVAVVSVVGDAGANGGTVFAEGSRGACCVTQRSHMKTDRH